MQNQRLPDNLGEGLFEPEVFDIYQHDTDELFIAAGVGVDTICAWHNIRDRALVVDPVTELLTRAHANMASRYGVATIPQNDFRHVRRAVLRFIEERHPSFARYAAQELRAMQPKRQPKPAEVISISDLRQAREVRQAEAQRAAIARELRLQDDGQIAAAF